MSSPPAPLGWVIWLIVIIAVVIIAIILIRELAGAIMVGSLATNINNADLLAHIPQLRV